MSNPADFTVLVLGGGLAGLGAARKLRAAGVKVLLLEGRGRLGGRVHTLKSGEGEKELDLGASWLHGTQGNSLYELLEAELPKVHRRLRQTDLEPATFRCVLHYLHVLFRWLECFGLIYHVSVLMGRLYDGRGQLLLPSSASTAWGRYEHDLEGHKSQVRLHFDQ